MNRRPPPPARDAHRVHGMANDEVAPDWPALSDEEAASVISRVRDGEGLGDGADSCVVWSSPRPMSAAALVRTARGEVFVKRHHRRVRGPARLRVEHDFARHLRDRGQPVARVVRFADGDTVFRRGEFVYEVHEKVTGVDLYREAPSWYPFASVAHAHAAGEALARFHGAARDFRAPATPPGVLMTSTDVVASRDPVLALEDLVTHRRALARALASRAFADEVAQLLSAPLRAAAPLVARLETQWGHGDWHPSNLTWSAPDDPARVVGVVDLGLANRTNVVHDLAVALERSTIDWLDLEGRGEVRADLAATDAFLDGYEAQRPLHPDERRALCAVVVVSHLEFALSEVEYFADVVRSTANTHLAYDGYLMGHVRWFAGSRGDEFIAHLRRRWD